MAVTPVTDDMRPAEWAVDNEEAIDEALRLRSMLRPSRRRIVRELRASDPG